MLNIIRVSPHRRWFVCVCCFTASFCGCLRQILMDSTLTLPTETSLIRICCTNWRMLPRWRSSETFPHWDTCSLLWPDPGALGLVQSYLAHMPPSQGLTYPWTNLIFLTGVFVQHQLKILINGQMACWGNKVDLCFHHKLWCSSMKGQLKMAHIRNLCYM